MSSVIRRFCCIEKQKESVENGNESHSDEEEEHIDEGLRSGRGVKAGRPGGVPHRNRIRAWW